MYRLCQKAFHSLCNLALCFGKLSFKIHGIQIQCSENQERFTKHRFIQITDIACQKLRIEIEDPLDFLTVLTGNRITCNNQYIAYSFNLQTEQQCLCRIDIAITAGHMRYDLQTKLPMKLTGHQ